MWSDIPWDVFISNFPSLVHAHDGQLLIAENIESEFKHVWHFHLYCACCYDQVIPYAVINCVNIGSGHDLEPLATKPSTNPLLIYHQ